MQSTWTAAIKYNMILLEVTSAFVSWIIIYRIVDIARIQQQPFITIIDLSRPSNTTISSLYRLVWTNS